MGEGVRRDEQNDPCTKILTRGLEAVVLGRRGPAKGRKTRERRVAQSRVLEAREIRVTAVNKPQVTPALVRDIVGIGRRKHGRAVQVLKRRQTKSGENEGECGERRNRWGRCDGGPGSSR